MTAAARSRGPRSTGAGVTPVAGAKHGRRRVVASRPFSSPARSYADRGRAPQVSQPSLAAHGKSRFARTAPARASPSTPGRRSTAFCVFGRPRAVPRPRRRR